MDGKHQKAENMDAGPGNGTYNMTSNLTKLGGMGAGPTSMTRVGRRNDKPILGGKGY